MKTVFSNRRVTAISLSVLFVLITLVTGVTSIFVADKNLEQQTPKLQNEEAQVVPDSVDGTDLTLEPVSFNKPTEMRAVYLMPGTDFLVGDDLSATTVQSQIDEADRKSVV